MENDLIMMKYFLITVALSYVDFAVSAAVCNADYCDPNWTPFKNMIYALRGYNIKTGNPIQNQGDPGFGSQIFLPTKINAQGRIELEAGITASDLSFCNRAMTSRTFSTIDSYRSYIQESSSTGIDLQIGTDTEVTVGVNIKAADISAKKTIPKPFERAWGESKDFTELTEFFTLKQGLVSISMGTCTMYEMKLDRFHFPPFTVPFTKALIELFEAKDDPSYIQKAIFQRFIKEYGTHFLLRSKMGAQYVYRTKFSKNVRSKMEADTLNDCNYVKGSKVFGIQVEQDKSGCSQTDESTLSHMSTEDVEASIITKGSRPTDIENWTTQDFIPIPLRFQLSPIINLFIDQYIGGIKTPDGKSLVSLEIRKWFVPLYFDFCNSMNIDCGVQHGPCGLNDTCPIDTVCQLSGDSRHRCTEWSGWLCTVNCGQGRQQTRTRQCFGCIGETQQYRDHLCKPQADCIVYNKNPKCYDTYTPSADSTSSLEHLINHRVECNAGYGIQRFELKKLHRVFSTQYRYEYKCCEIQLPCTKTTSISNTPTTHYLDRGNPGDLKHQLVTCGKTAFLRGFALRLPSVSQITYDYKCCSNVVKDMIIKHSCYDDTTSYFDINGAKCKAPYTLSSFQLTRYSSGNYMYKFTCCKVFPY